MLFFPQLISTSSLSKMNLLNIKKLAAALTVACSLASLHAATITLPDPIAGYDRQATLTSAVEGYVGEGNALQANINGYFGGIWTKVGDVNAGNGVSNGFLTITFDGPVAWDTQPPISGTWSISSGFFDLYGSAVISMHVGGGQGSPDHFAWLISPGNTTGTWSYDVNNSNGGGLSNLGLWGSGPPTTRVPDSASTLLLIGLGLASVGFVARRRKV